MFLFFIIYDIIVWLICFQISYKLIIGEKIHVMYNVTSEYCYK